MSRIHPESRNTEGPGRSIAAAVFLRQEPDDGEDEGDGKEDDTEDGKNDDGYSE